MAENTSIEWCDHTWSPVWGCTEVSKAETGGGGCDNCYARELAHRFGTGWNGAPMREFGEHHWNEPLRWNRRAAAAGTRPRVFPSMCDPFDKNWTDGVRERFFALIEQTPNLDWMLLTKRIGNVKKMLPSNTSNEDAADFARLWPNVWIGATIVNQEEADRDIPKLLQVPAAKRFLSMEPLLDAVTVFSIDGPVDVRDGEASPIDWVIVGGESGPGARPMHPDWARSLRDQCQAAGVPFMFKQWGNWSPARDGVEIVESTADHKFDDGTWMERVGKKQDAGRQLDGRTWDEVPA